ncbi:MAG: hypothetical protein HY858_04900 [Candidatus Solibacter usitatus]|nr:hypothetical protein [Candidatus Solibacter usitatus]
MKYCPALLVLLGWLAWTPLARPGTPPKPEGKEAWWDARAASAKTPRQAPAQASPAGQSAAVVEPLRWPGRSISGRLGSRWVIVVEVDGTPVSAHPR